MPANSEACAFSVFFEFFTNIFRFLTASFAGGGTVVILGNSP
jgi:hypothetical protein